MGNYRQYVRAGRGRSDLTDLFASLAGLTAAIEEMSEPFTDMEINKVVGLDALGFVFATRIAHCLNAGLVLIRKGGKLSVASKKTHAFVDYTQGEKSFEVASDALGAEDRVLVVDDWSETDSQLKSAIGLVESFGAKCWELPASTSTSRSLPIRGFQNTECTLFSPTSDHLLPSRFLLPVTWEAYPALCSAT